MAATVTIGRHVGEEPMAQARWSAFRAQVFVAVRAASSAVYYVTEVGRGGWEGTPEEAYTVVFEPVADRQDALRDDLRGLRALYDQDAIAYTVGRTELL